VRYVVAESRLAGCEMVANTLAREPRALPETVILCTDARVAVLLDACLARYGLPTMGGTRATAALPALQVLPLVLQLCWEPVDPAVLLDLISLPIGPVARHVGRRLADALAEQPGLGSAAWEDAWKALTGPEADPAGELAEKLHPWFSHERVRRGEPLPQALVMERSGCVAQWAVARSTAGRGEDVPAGDPYGLLTLAGQATALGELVAAQAGPFARANSHDCLKPCRLTG